MMNDYMKYYRLSDWLYEDAVHPAEKRMHFVPLSILPTKSVTRKLNRAGNRLLPKGRRHRGDLRVA